MVKHYVVKPYIRSNLLVEVQVDIQKGKFKGCSSKERLGNNKAKNNVNYYTMAEFKAEIDKQLVEGFHTDIPYICNKVYDVANDILGREDEDETNNKTLGKFKRGRGKKI